MCGAIRSKPARFWAPSLALLLLAGGPSAAADADSTRADSLPTPRAALWRSAVLPGWGQHYNGRPFKALFFAGASAAALTAVVAEQRQIGDAPTPEIHQDRAARRNTRLLYFALSTAFAAIDAYVDAQLADFDADINVRMQPDAVIFVFNTTLPERD